MNVLLSFIILLPLIEPPTPTEELVRTLDALYDDLRIMQKNAKVAPGSYRVVDTKNDGAIRIEGDGITVDFSGAQITGHRDGQTPDRFTGTGILIKGRDVTIRNLKISGFKVGVRAIESDNLTIEDVDVSNNFHQRLKSTPDAENTGDWLWPHENDNHEWIKRYGAGLCVERSSGVTVRRVRARNCQNGIILDRVDNSRIYDNDCSFLSGWGLAMWRSSDNIVTHNAFDFCIRGYSHGVYNRGQDSAGILMFEQCNKNVIAHNSATHGGDGLFGFGGNESLAGKGRTGNNANRIHKNDFSYAAAHGLELTFSFGNRMTLNRFVGNAICGIWGGYSQQMLIDYNEFVDNGGAGYGLERGGINIEHGHKNIIRSNRFEGNACGIHLWDDDDPHLADKPWIKANEKGSTWNTIWRNRFERDAVGIHLRRFNFTTVEDNEFSDVREETIFESPGREAFDGPTLLNWLGGYGPSPTDIVPRNRGATKDPVDARRELRGRDKIIMTEWGPYDYTSYDVFPRHVSGGASATVNVLGPDGEFAVQDVKGDVNVEPKKGSLPGKITIAKDSDGLHPFLVNIRAGEELLTVRGSLLSIDWDVRFFHWNRDTGDPREHADKWQDLLVTQPVDQLQTKSIDFKWPGAPTARVNPDHFGTAATGPVTLPAGKYKITTVSDDGIRVLVDGYAVIEDWTWHAPKEHSATIDLEEGPHTFDLEHFEIDGYARLKFDLQLLPD